MPIAAGNVKLIYLTRRIEAAEKNGRIAQRHNYERRPVGSRATAGLLPWQL